MQCNSVVFLLFKYIFWVMYADEKFRHSHSQCRSRLNSYRMPFDTCGTYQSLINPFPLSNKENELFARTKERKSWIYCATGSHKRNSTSNCKKKKNVKHQAFGPFKYHGTWGQRTVGLKTSGCHKLGPPRCCVVCRGNRLFCNRDAKNERSSRNCQRISSERFSLYQILD